MKLNLGCGDQYLAGWINIDVRPEMKADLHEDIYELPSMKKNSVEAIYACHVLEHFGFGVIKPTYHDVLKKWYDILIPGGSLFVCVPDIKVIAKVILSTNTYQQHKNIIQGALFGGCDYNTNVHKVAFSEEMLIQTLKEVGFNTVRKFKPFIVGDTSTFKSPIFLNECISLNLEGVK